MTRSDYAEVMDTAVIPQISIEPKVLDQLKSMLREGETVASFVEAAVRSEVERRRVHKEFDARTQDALEAYERTGVSVPVEVVLRRLQAKLDAKVLALKQNRGAVPDSWRPPTSDTP
ncbi:MAG: YlcI/YnfO family protein [Ideonella sp.]|nr:YlcI/YnfO family protein [Ideonella sp.]